MMSNTASIHADCENFIPVDVAKGICTAHSTEIPADGESCPLFATAPKCKNCRHFTDPDEKGTGNCTGFTDAFWSYPELRAQTCEEYTRR